MKRLAMADHQRRLERLRYWQGQRLCSRDLNDQAAVVAQLRWWHNRALHQAYGVWTGLDCRIVDKQTLKVAAGAGYDWFGREILLFQDRELPVPPAALPPGDDAVLLCRYREAGRFPGREEVAGVCFAPAPLKTPPGPLLNPDPSSHPGPALTPLQEQPEFCWKPSGMVTLQDGLPLARVLYDSGRPQLNPKFSPPRCRALTRPHIASGTTVPGNTPWEEWQFIFSTNERKIVVPLGIQVRINTAAAGFKQLPCYFAWLQGAWQQPEATGENVASWPPIPMYLEHIAKASATGFTYRFWLPYRPVVDLKILGAVMLPKALAAGRQNLFTIIEDLYVCWLGVEPGKEK